MPKHSAECRWRWATRPAAPIAHRGCRRGLRGSSLLTISPTLLAGVLGASWQRPPPPLPLVEWAWTCRVTAAGAGRARSEAVGVIATSPTTTSSTAPRAAQRAGKFADSGLQKSNSLFQFQPASPFFLSRHPHWGYAHRIEGGRLADRTVCCARAGSGYGGGLLISIPNRPLLFYSDYSYDYTTTTTLPPQSPHHLHNRYASTTITPPPPPPPPQSPHHHIHHHHRNNHHHSPPPQPHNHHNHNHTTTTTTTTQPPQPPPPPPRPQAASSSGASFASLPHHQPMLTARLGQSTPAR